MTYIGDAAMLTRLILDIISMYQDRGVDIDLDNLEEKIADMNAQRKKAMEQLKE